MITRSTQPKAAVTPERQLVDLNAARKRRAGLSDDGRCAECGQWRRICRAINECATTIKGAL